MLEYLWNAFWRDEKLYINLGSRPQNVTVWDINEDKPNDNSYNKSRDKIAKWQKSFF